MIRTAGDPGNVECAIRRSLNAVPGKFLPDAEALLAQRLAMDSPEPIACQASLHPFYSARGAYHHG